MPAGVRCALIPTAFGLRETHERERRQDRGVARVAPNPRVPRAGAAPSSISGRNTTRRPLRAPVSRRCSRRYPLPGRARAVRREASRGARARREREPRTRPRPNLAFCAAAPSSISGGTATRGSPRAREAPPIPAGERLRRPRRGRRAPCRRHRGAALGRAALGRAARAHFIGFLDTRWTALPPAYYLGQMGTSRRRESGKKTAPRIRRPDAKVRATRAETATAKGSIPP